MSIIDPISQALGITLMHINFDSSLFIKESIPGTFKGCNHSDETKVKMSLLKKDSYFGANNPAYGKKRPDLSERNKKGHSPEMRAKMSASRQNRVWVKRDDTQTLIAKGDLQTYLLLGWQQGRCRF